MQNFVKLSILVERITRHLLVEAHQSFTDIATEGLVRLRLVALMAEAVFLRAILEHHV